MNERERCYNLACITCAGVRPGMLHRGRTVVSYKFKRLA